MNIERAALALTALLALGGCGKSSQEPVQATATSLPEGWLGRWQGPEGTYLDIAGKPGAYRVTVSNLDGPRGFDATAGAGSVSFVRDGVQETIKAGSGADTGMKWLAGKTNCLVVKAGEGYCRG